MMSNDAPTFTKFTGKHMLAAMLGFFAVILCANLVMVYFAQKSWTGLITQHSYKENQVFDKKTEDLKKMYELGLNLTASYKNGKITIYALDQNKQEVSGAVLDLIAGRVIHERDDQALRLSEVGKGRYEILHFLKPGRWQLKVSMKLAEGHSWKKTYYIQVEQ